jgi:hypothetical protein
MTGKVFDCDFCRAQLKRRIKEVYWCDAAQGYNPLDPGMGMMDVTNEAPPEPEIKDWVNPANKKKPEEFKSMDYDGQE